MSVGSMAPLSTATAAPDLASRGDDTSEGDDGNGTLSARTALGSLGDADVRDILSPMQLEALLGSDQAAEVITGADLSAAAAAADMEELRYLLSPLQFDLVRERHNKGKRSTMLCGNFFHGGASGSSAAVRGVRGAPMLPTVFVQRSGIAGRASAATAVTTALDSGSTAANAAPAGLSSRGESSTESVSTDDTASVNSRTSSLSWITDDGRGAGTNAPLDPGIAKVPRSSTGLESQSQRTSGGHPSGSAARVGQTTPLRYGSYKQMPTWEEMAQRTVQRMRVWVSPNSRAPWETKAQSTPSPAASAAMPSMTSPVASTLFQRAAAAAAARRAEQERNAGLVAKGGATPSDVPGAVAPSGGMASVGKLSCGTLVWPESRAARAHAPDAVRSSGVTRKRATSGSPPASPAMGSGHWATARPRRSPSPTRGRLVCDDLVRGVLAGRRRAISP